MNIQEILRGKGTDVFTISPDATIAQMVRELVDHNCGSVVVCKDGKMVGIITERDVLRVCAAKPDTLTELRVKDYMSDELITGSPSDKVETIMGVMTEKRIRHLPVVDDGGKLAGLISIGDVVKAQHQQLNAENVALKDYIQGG